MMAGLVVAWLVAGGIDLGTQGAVLLAAGPLAVGLGLLAVSRFEWFVWTVLIVRPSLDAVGGMDNFGPGPMVSAMFLVVAVIWLVVQRRAGHWTRPGPVSVALGIFAVAITLSIVTSEMRIVSATAGLEILAGISMFLVLEQLLPGRVDRLKRLVVAVLASAVIPVTVALQQWISGGGTARGVVTRIDGTFVHPNPFATYLVVVMILGYCAAVTVDGAKRNVLFGYVAVLGVVVMLTYSRGGWIALLIAATYLGYRRRRWVPIAVLVLAAGLVAFVPSVGDRLSDLSDDETWLPEGVPRNSLEWRFQYWGDLIPLADASPITGIGPQVVLNSRPEALEPHNVFVQSYVELGILGLAALVGVIVASGVALARRRRQAGTRVERVYAEGATAAMLVLFVLLPSENLLNATINWWYLAACATWGFHARAWISTQRPPRLRIDEFVSERQTTHG